MKIYAYCLAAVLFCFGCAPRVSYSVRVLHEEPNFSGRSLSKADIALLPLLGVGGSAENSELAPDSIAFALWTLRPDLKIVAPDAFEEEFYARFDMRVLPDLYAGILREEMLAVKAMGDVWRNITHQYLLVFSLQDGASVHNADAGVFRHVSVKCELWSREKREVVWRAQCKGVSDNGDISDARLISESIRRLAEAIPSTPDYGKGRR